MNSKLLLTSALAISISACGGIDLGLDAGTDAGTDAGVDAGVDAGLYVFSTGTYAVTNAMVAPSTTDQCGSGDGGIFSTYQAPDKKIGVDVTASLVTFNLANSNTAPVESLPKATLSGNAITSPVEANYTIAFGTTCVVRVKRTVVGNVVANGTAALTLNYSVATETGSCAAAGTTAFTAVPCASTYQFTATKQ